MSAVLPPFLSTGHPGSFALRTIVERKPRIVAQVLESNRVFDEVRRRRSCAARRAGWRWHDGSCAGCFPAPFACLRTMKSEIVVDVPREKAESPSAADPQWLINGRRGLLRYCPGRMQAGEGSGR